jgi:hypothetical protein
VARTSAPLSGSIQSDPTILFELRARGETRSSTALTTLPSGSARVIVSPDVNA